MNKNVSHQLESFDKEVDHGLQLLKEHKIRITPQRRALLEYLINTDQHPTVDEIFNDLSQNEMLGISLATIYNNLKVLVDVGLVNEMKFSNVTSRYDYKGHNHRHILCTNCGNIGDFHYDEIVNLDKIVAEQTGYQVSFNKLEVYGLCPECQKLLKQ
ncbi:transcriptional repressor [Aerococcaceae bacterium DSM 111176]|nr:transcriptional repressor [Aerococcaceae bacterium DSM 111176]